MNKNRFIVVAGFIFIAALSRILPHPPNFAPIVGMSLFGAAYLANKKWALIIPVAAMFLSDLIINNTIYAAYYDSFQIFSADLLWVYLPIILIVAFGFYFLQKISTSRVFFGSIIASVIFFIISNLGVWASGTLYPLTMEGLIACFTAALPFFQNTVLGAVFYSALMFGGFELASNKVPALQPVQPNS